MNNITEGARKEYKERRKMSKEDWKYIYMLTETIYPFLIKRLEQFISTWGAENVQLDYTLMDYPPRIMVFADFTNKDGMITEFGTMMGEYCTKFNMLSWCIDGHVPHGWDVRKNYILKKDIEKEMEIKDKYESNG